MPDSYSLTASPPHPPHPPRTPPRTPPHPPHSPLLRARACVEADGDLDVFWFGTDDLIPLILVAGELVDPVCALAGADGTEREHHVDAFAIAVGNARRQLHLTLVPRTEMYPRLPRRRQAAIVLARRPRGPVGTNDVGWYSRTASTKYVVQPGRRSAPCRSLRW